MGNICCFREQTVLKKCVQKFFAILIVLYTYLCKQAVCEALCCGNIAISKYCRFNGDERHHHHYLLTDYASRRSRTRDAVKLTRLCVCVYSSCNCSAVAMRRKLTASIATFSWISIRGKLKLCSRVMATVKAVAVSSESCVVSSVRTHLFTLPCTKALAIC